MESFAAFLSAIAWPAVAVVALTYFRDPIGRFLERFATAVGEGRGIKVGVGGVNIELAEARQASTEQVARIADLTFAAEPGGIQSSGSQITAAIVEGEPVEAMTIDLGDGDAFLTSRLYIATAMMTRQRGLRTVAFQYTSGVREAVYFGCCTADDLLAALAKEYPEYEAAFALAIHHGWWVTTTPSTALRQPGPWPLGATSAPRDFALEGGRRLPRQAATNVVGEFITLLTTRPAPPPVDAGWVPLPPRTVPDRAERASWVTPEWLRRHLGHALYDDRVERGASNEAIVAAVLASHAPCVGLVDGRSSLVELISRPGVLEQVARSTLRQTRDGAHGR